MHVDHNNYGAHIPVCMLSINIGERGRIGIFMIVILGKYMQKLMTAANDVKQAKMKTISCIHASNNCMHACSSNCASFISNYRVL